MEVSFTVAGASGLVGVDKGLLGSANSDPYVKVSWGGKPLGQSKVVYRSKSPTWNYRVSFTVRRDEWDATMEEFALLDDEVTELERMESDRSKQKEERARIEAARSGVTYKKKKKKKKKGKKHHKKRGEKHE